MFNGIIKRYIINKKKLVYSMVSKKEKREQKPQLLVLVTGLFCVRKIVHDSDWLERRKMVHYTCNQPRIT